MGYSLNVSLQPWLSVAGEPSSSFAVFHLKQRDIKRYISGIWLYQIKYDTFPILKLDLDSLRSKSHVDDAQEPQ